MTRSAFPPQLPQLQLPGGERRFRARLVDKKSQPYQPYEQNKPSSPTIQACFLCWFTNHPNKQNHPQNITRKKKSPNSCSEACSFCSTSFSDAWDLARLASRRRNERGGGTSARGLVGGGVESRLRQNGTVGGFEIHFAHSVTLK